MRWMLRFEWSDHFALRNGSLGPFCLLSAAFPRTTPQDSRARTLRDTGSERGAELSGGSRTGRPASSHVLLVQPP